MHKKKTLITAYLVLIATVIIAYLFTPLKEILAKENIRSIVSSAGIFAPLIFAAIHISFLLLFLPDQFLVILAGTIFGLPYGMAITITTATIAAIISFFISRNIGKNARIKKKSRTLERIKIALDKNLDKNGLFTLILLRFVLFHYMLFNYAAGLVKKVKTKDFLLSTIITNLFGSFSMVYLGSALGGTWKDMLPPIIIASFFFILVPFMIRKFKKDMPDQIE
ncbi:MAG: TVP38/TMEM64 family protein [Candidatus Woesearchaeota archaeon]